MKECDWWSEGMSLVLKRYGGMWLVPKRYEGIWLAMMNGMKEGS
jgi:hypothetical protein